MDVFHGVGMLHEAVTCAQSIAQKVEAKIIAAALAEGVSMDASPKQVDAFFSEANKKRVQRLIQNYVLRYPRA